MIELVIAYKLKKFIKNQICKANLYQINYFSIKTDNL